MNGSNKLNVCAPVVEVPTEDGLETGGRCYCPVQGVPGAPLGQVPLDFACAMGIPGTGGAKETGC